MSLQLFVSVCMENDCQKVIGCTVDGSTFTIKTECHDCDQPPECGVAKNKDLFLLSHGLCQQHFEERMKGEKHAKALNM